MAGAKTPWMTSDDLIATVKRRIMFPESEVTYNDEDILQFAVDEMFGSQIPSVLQYHEEYFLQTVTVPLVPNQVRYPIPNRALGMKLRTIFYQDITNQLYDMTRVNLNDQSYFLNNTQTSNTPYMYYTQNNDIVLSVTQLNEPSGNLIMTFYMRPNQLVTNDQAATVQSFQKTTTIDASEMSVGDTFSISTNTAINAPPIHGENLAPPNAFVTGAIGYPTIVKTFTAVASNAQLDQFVLDPSSIVTATNLVNAINTDNAFTATNGNPGTNQVSVTYFDINSQFLTSNSSAMIIPTNYTFVVDQVPTSFTNNTYYDLLQTEPGHKIINWDIFLGNNTISGNTITVPFGVVPPDFSVGDYVCLANQCIIPMMPPEIHNVLAERTCARILSALGDTEALQNTNTKIQEMELRQGNMLDNRVEGNPQKVLPRGSILSYSKTFRRGIL